MTLMSRLQNVCLLAVLFFICGPLPPAAASDAAKAGYHIADLTWQQKGDGWQCQISGDAVPAYTMYELFSPHRVIIDIASGTFPGSINFPLKYAKGPVSSIKGEVFADQNPTVARLELLLADDSAYAVTGSGNDILVQFKEQAQETGTKKNARTERQINDITVSADGNATAIHVLADGPIQKYQSSELTKENTHPARLVVDLPGMASKGHAVPVSEDAPVTLVRAENYKDGTRLILDSATGDLFRYSIAPQEDGLVINVEEAADTAQVVAAITGVASDEGAQPKPPANNAPAQAAEKTPSAMVTKSAKTAAEKTDSDFEGYTEQRISVDFYKIDLHNVFRLIGEISGRNIVVDEKVGGSLTLTLNDVPWDFVLDVILNLKGLSKEERYNTIVISEKSAEFSWPQRAQEALAIERKEAISVTKKMDVPKEKIEGTKYIREAKNMEEAGNDAGALALYEKAFQIWPENGELAKRITYLALVKLGQNAKAAHYGQIAADLLPQDTEVALQAALSLANMQRSQEAKSYFDFAVSGSRPSRQALASYAAFSEQNNSNEMALALLARFEQIYGTSLETMVSKARIYDKLGNTEKASQEYQAILLSGFQVPTDLEAYIKERLQK
jgi:type IV pilus assembly protein PilQ